MLASRPLVFFGKYSYGMYVIHALILPGLLVLLPTEEWLAFFGNQTMLASLTLAGTKIGITTILAIFSFHFYEKVSAPETFLRTDRNQPCLKGSKLAHIYFGCTAMKFRKLLLASAAVFAMSALATAANAVTVSIGFQQARVSDGAVTTVACGTNTLVTANGGYGSFASTASAPPAAAKTHSATC